MKHCDKCQKETVHRGGRNWCPDHLYRYDTPLIMEMLQADSELVRDEFFICCFKTVHPTFSLFPLLYKKFPQVKRGEWLGVKSGFEKSQLQYLNECFKQWLKERLKWLKS